MNKQFLKTVLFPLLSVSLLLLPSCGGGGGGSGVPASYTGLTTQAVITDTNAATIVIGAWTGGVSARDLGDVVPASLAATDQGPPGPDLLDQVQNLVNLAVRSLPEFTPTVKPLELIPATCSSGFADVNITANQTTGAFSGSIVFTDYCDMGVTLNGTMTVSGLVDINLMIATRMTMGFNNLSATDGVMSWSFLEGTISYIVAADFGGETDTLNLVVRDDVAQKSYWMQNYVIQITYGLPDTVTITGRYYDPDYGFCDITTLVTLEVAFTPLPNAGVLLFTGDGSKARLTFNSDQTNLLEVDANNDDVYETGIPNPL